MISTTIRTDETLIDGTFYFGKNGVGFVRTPQLEYAVEIPAHATNKALHKDKVRVRITDTDTTTGAVGEVVEITRRDKHGYIGILEHIADKYVVVPADRYNHLEIVIADADRSGAQVNDRVFVTLGDWDTFPTGRIEKVLPSSSTTEGHMQAYALERGFDEVFPPEAQDEADLLAERGIQAEDLVGRRDMRGITTFTIDPDDAKDFDDALSFQTLANGSYEVGIHIADVSQYVQEGTALDEEAQKRATSVYLVDRTVPMLPEELSNNLCSLRADEDKLTFSVVVTLTPDGMITDKWYGRTVIRSDKRFTYEEAQIGIETGTEPFPKELVLLNTLAKKYRDQRIADGALTLEKEELRFIIDEDGNPLGVRKKIRKDAHKMIEEWMLLANRLVAEYMTEHAQKSFMIYRVHERPEIKRVLDLKRYLSTMGYEVPVTDGVIAPAMLQKIIDEAPNNDVRDALSLAIARSMMKAIYTTDNIGHYGLAFEDYTHFTSPIRRYPDIMVHRLLYRCLQGNPIHANERDTYDEMAAHASTREADAAEAERTSIHYMQARYMQDKVGQIFDGMITGLSKSGMFVAERETKCEGMIAFRNIGNDYYSFDPKESVVWGEKTGAEFRAGDQVRIKLLKVDVENRMIDYGLVV